MLTESPVVLWLLAAGVVVLERLSVGLRDDLTRTVVVRLEEALPIARDRFAWQAWEVPTLEARLLVLMGPLLLLFLLVRCGLDLRAIRAHRQILETGSWGSSREEGPRLLKLFQFRLLAWGLVLGSLSLAALPGLLVLWWGIESFSLAISLFGLFLILLFGLPVWAYVSLGIYTGDRLLIFEQLGPVDALESAWELARGNRMGLLVFRLVSLGYKVLGILSGLLLCGVGVLVTWPLSRAVAEAALSEAVLVSRGGDLNPPTWKMLVAHE
jgi:hypothetical protein